MKLLIAGDFCPQHRVKNAIEQNLFSSVFESVSNIVHNHDYSIVNLECPVIDDNFSPIRKNGPNLYCSEKGIEALVNTGFKCVTLANNHFFDYGNAGVKKTLDTCRKYDIDTVGGGDCIQEASKILYKTIDNERIAIINCCEHEFSIASNGNGGSNPINPIKISYNIKEARSKSDYILVIVHGGHECFQLPSLRMQEVYRFFIDAGADIVINHHQHCYSGYEDYKGKRIYYGLGNFCFDNPNYRNNNWNLGYLVSVRLERGFVDSNILPYLQCDSIPSVVILPSNSFDEKIEELNNIIKDSGRLTTAIYDYYRKASVEMASVLEPYIKIISVLQRKNLFPSLKSKKWLLKLQNYILCESHRDKLNFYFEMFNYK